MRYWPLCVLGIVIQIAFIVIESKKKYVPAVICKGGASVVFVLLGLLSAQLSTDGNFARLIVIGLLLGALGDILLNLRFGFTKAGQTIFLIGIVAFLSGHILYLAALLTVAGNPIWWLVAGAVFVALLLWWIFHTLGEIKKAFKIFGIVYIDAISLMCAVALGNWLANPQAPGALLFFIGAILFLVSDVILIFNTFGTEQKLSMRAANLTLYYLGQLLLAVSLQFV